MERICQEQVAWTGCEMEDNEFMMLMFDALTVSVFDNSGNHL